MLRPRVSFTILVVLSTILIGWTVLSPDEPPRLTVENQDETRYQLTVFTAPNAGSPTDVTFRATTEAGDRRYVGLADLQSGATYYNVTLAEDEVRSRHLTVRPTSDTTTTVEAWKPGNTWGYIVEGDDNESIIGSDVITCERERQRAQAQVTIVDGFQEQWTTHCS